MLVSPIYDIVEVELADRPFNGCTKGHYFTRIKLSGFTNRKTNIHVDIGGLSMQ
jgi:hypothetical protein